VCGNANGGGPPLARGRSATHHRSTQSLDLADAPAERTTKK
jgi:hypothetical protein